MASRSRELMVDGLINASFEKFVQMHDSMARYRDETLFRQEFLEAGTELGRTLKAMGVFAGRRDKYVATLPTATVTQMATAVDEADSDLLPPDPAPAAQEERKERRAWEDD